MSEMSKWVYNAVKFEDLNASLTQTKMIIKNGRAVGVNKDDTQTILNLYHGFKMIGERCNEDLFSFSKRVNGIVAKEDALFPGEFRSGDVTVSTAMGTYAPQLLKESDIKNQFNFLQYEPDSPIKAGLLIFLFMTKNQVFWDGNKRTAIITVNRYFRQQKLGTFMIGEGEFNEFNILLGKYYLSNLKKDEESILLFMESNCIFG